MPWRPNLPESAPITHKHEQLTRRSVFRNLHRNALNKLLSRFRPDIGLNFNLFATAISFIQGQFAQASPLVGVGGRNVERHSFDLNIVKTTTKERTDWRSHRAGACIGEFAARSGDPGYGS